MRRTLFTRQLVVHALHSGRSSVSSGPRESHARIVAAAFGARRLTKGQWTVDIVDLLRDGHARMALLLSHDARRYLLFSRSSPMCDGTEAGPRALKVWSVES